MRMNAAILRDSGASAPYVDSRPLSVETVELASPGLGEICVRIRAAGLCHSDLSVIDGSRPRPLPMVLGHEAAGEIVEVGPGVVDLYTGDQVVFSFVPMCGHCGPCAAGRAALCEPGARANASGELLAGGRRLSDAAGQPLNHLLGVASFAEYCVVSVRSVVRVDRDLPAEIAALFGCAVVTGVGAVVNTARVSPGQSVAVFGLGGVGMAALLGAKATGAFPLIAVDVSAEKLAVAHDLGAHHCLNPRDYMPDSTRDHTRNNPHEDGLVTSLRDLTGGGVDFAIESVGSEAVFGQAYASTRRGGTTLTVGLPAPDRMISVPALNVVAEERTIKGSYMGSAVPSRDLPRFIAMYRAGLLPVDRLLTHRLKLAEINLGFDRLRRAEAIRQVILFD